MEEAIELIEGVAVDLARVPEHDGIVQLPAPSMRLMVRVLNRAAALLRREEPWYGTA